MTIKDLAALTGYSVGTISRVLNNQPNVSEKARLAIRQAAEEYGFQLNENAKQLKQQHGTAILVIVKGTSNELFAGLVEAIQARIAQTEYPLIVDYIDEDGNEVRRAAQLFREKKPRGILFLGGNKENFQGDFGKITVPCVLVTNNGSDFGFDNLSSVSSDDILAASMAIDHLFSLGHRQIALIGGDLSSSNIARLRFRGCMEAFSRHDLAFDLKSDYRGVRFSFEGGYRAATELLATGRPFSAIFAMSDVMAIGAIRALQDAGKRVPEDMSIMGFDGLLIGEFTVPRLSTIRQDVTELAQRSIQLLLQQITGPGVPTHLTVDVALAQRESAGNLK